MKFREVRNQIVSRLSRYLGISVYLSNQVNPEQEYPFVIYSTTAPYIPDNGMGVFLQMPLMDGTILEVRKEQPTCSFSFTACSVNRDGILGDDEALELAEKAQGWFLHTGYSDISGMGITVVDVANVQERSFLQIDEEARRYGFDVMLRYVRTDERVIDVVEHVVTIEKGETDE